MTTYLATIRIEAFGLAEAKKEVACIAEEFMSVKAVVSVVQEREPYVRLEPDEEFKTIPPEQRRSSAEILREMSDIFEKHRPPPAPPRYVTEAIEAAKAELRAEMRDVAKALVFEHRAKVPHSSGRELT